MQPAPNWHWRRCWTAGGHSGSFWRIRLQWRRKNAFAKNDPEVLKDNLLPYELADHIHEREVSLHIGRDIRFLPHVAPFFRGISLTCAVELRECDRRKRIAGPVP